MTATAYKATSVEKDKFAQTHKVPMVWFHQPKQFALLQDPADLRQWESDMREKVGLADLPIAGTETCCESNATNDCDTD